ncbi:uncharacterized protein J4E78_010425 [Alternaria triticimaculans]|uniref:uncharacterized protein n=1 Tax=Alternaria triticimaculans TaxID=297637 RepID=UPI0020C4F421|nr:uncharacterized protein J4E78_010425 [Alternaria triticimaculans]KAI4641362.1 hypothetical protein J4E78_010425 [Alternaria triticimaculans]
MDSTEIFDLASECYKLFRETFPEDTLPPDAQMPLYRALFHCRSRFETWAGYTNALENGEDSLDKQLEFSPADDLQIVTWCLVATRMEEVQRVPKNPKLRTIHEAMDRLQRASDTKLRDKDGFDRVAAAVVKGAYPDLPETLVQQLGSSIARRRARLLRQRKHQHDLDLQRQQGYDAQTVAAEDTKSVAQAQDKMMAALEKLSVTEHPVLEPKKLSDDASTQQKVGSKVWYCDLHLDEEVHVMHETFQSEESLRQHLKDDHRDLPPLEIDTKVRRNTRRPSRSWDICLFCGFDAGAKVDPDNECGAEKESSTRYAGLRARKARDMARLVLWNHIAQHLKSLAFISLRWCEDKKVNAEGVDVKTNAASRGGSSEDEEAASVAGQ